MSIYRVDDRTVAKCDRCGVTYGLRDLFRAVEIVGFDELSAKWVRSAMSGADGWTYESGRDLCEDCRYKIEDEAAA